MSTPENPGGDDVRPPQGNGPEGAPEQLQGELEIMGARLDALERDLDELRGAVQDVVGQLADHEDPRVREGMAALNELLPAPEHVQADNDAGTADGQDADNAGNGASDDTPVPPAVPPTAVHDAQPRPERRGRFGRRVLAVGAIAAAAVAAVAVFGHNNDSNETKQIKNIPAATAEQNTQAETGKAIKAQAVRSLQDAKAQAAHTMGADADLLGLDAEVAKAKAQARADAREDAHDAMLKRADQADTVATATKALRGGEESLPSNLAAIQKMKPKDVNHAEGAMNRVDAVFPVGKLGPVNGAEAIAFGWAGSAGNVTASYNAAHGLEPSAELPNGVTVKEARAWLFNQAKKSPEFNLTQLKQAKMNHGQRGEDVFKAGVVQPNGGQRNTITWTLANGKKVEYKLFNNNCINVLSDIDVMKQIIDTSKPMSGGTANPGGGNPGNNPGNNPNNANPGGGNPDNNKPQRAQPGGGNPSNEQPPAQQDERKQDDGRLPGSGIPADQDKGTPDKEGTAPAQAGDSPADVPRQPQDPLPTPQQPSSETQNRPPAEEGQGPANPDPNGSATVPGTSNNQGQGGSVDPNAA